MEVETKVSQGLKLEKTLVTMFEHYIVKYSFESEIL